MVRSNENASLSSVVTESHLPSLLSLPCEKLKLVDISPVLVHAGVRISGVLTVSCAGLTMITMRALYEHNYC